MKFFTLLAVLFLCIGFVLAAQGEGQMNSSGVNNNSGQNNASQQNSGSVQQAVQQQTQEQARIQVRDGTHLSEDGKQVRIQTQANNRIRLETGGISAECACNFTQEKIQNRTKFKATLSNGKNAEIKIMPDTASERALERLKLKVCSSENGCSIELKEVTSGKETKLAYELKTQRQSRLFGLFKKQMQVQAQIDAESGEVIDAKKPWWAFLASEPEQ